MKVRKPKILQNYELLSANGMPCNLGFGAYGSVQLGKSLKTGQTVAIKKISRKIAIGEVQVHMKLDHPNIIKMYDFCFDEEHQTTYIILEYAEKGSLFQYMHEIGLNDKKMIKQIFISVCSAINYMHKKKIMHRDIKPQNILLGRKNEVKICDFGFSVQCEPRMTLCGTVQYMAPQMILHKPYTQKIDVWSLGILYFELLQGHAPFEGSNQQIVLSKMKKEIYFSEKFEEDEIALIQKILQIDPNQRPEVSEIINNNCFRKSTKSSSSVSKRSTIEQQKLPQSKIRIVDIKDLNLSSPDKKNIIQIKSIRDLNSSTEIKIEPTTYKQISSTKQKISLKRSQNKHHQ